MNFPEALLGGFVALCVAGTLTGVGYFVHLDGAQKAKVDLACVQGGGKPDWVDVKNDGKTDRKVCIYQNDN